MQAENLRKIVNALMFQIAWFGVVLAHNPWAFAIAGLFLLVHFAFIAQRPVQEALFIGVASMLGIAFDVVWFSLGWLHSGSHGIYPLWLAAMWPLFLATLHHSLSWLQGRLLFASVLGAIFAPLSYFGGAKLSPVTLTEPVWALGAISLFWAVFLPICYWQLGRVARNYSPA